MTATDRSTASAADFDAALAVWEAATPDPDGRVEIVARALEEACVDGATWTTLAVAALAAAPKVPGPLAPAASDPTAALRDRVEALAEELDFLVDDETVDQVARVSHAWTLRRLRAALAPQPADAEETGR